MVHRLFSLFRCGSIENNWIKSYESQLSHSAVFWRHQRPMEGDIPSGAAQSDQWINCGKTLKHFSAASLRNFASDREPKATPSALQCRNELVIAPLLELQAVGGKNKTGNQSIYFVRSAKNRQQLECASLRHKHCDAKLFLLNNIITLLGMFLYLKWQESLSLAH